MSLFLFRRLASSISWIEGLWGSKWSTLTALTASDNAWLSNQWSSPEPFGRLKKKWTRWLSTKWTFKSFQRPKRFTPKETASTNSFFTTHRLCSLPVWSVGSLASVWNYHWSFRGQFRLTLYLASCKPPASLAKVLHRLRPVPCSWRVTALKKAMLPRFPWKNDNKSRKIRLTKFQKGCWRFSEVCSSSTRSLTVDWRCSFQIKIPAFRDVTDGAQLLRVAGK